LLLEAYMRFSHLLLLLVGLTGFSLAQETNFSVGPQYLSITGPSIFLQPIATKSISLDTPLSPVPSPREVAPPASFVSNPVLEGEADLFPIYYGYPPLPVIWLVGTQPEQLPESITTVSYIEFVDAQTLRERGIGVSVAEAAAFSKGHRSRAAKVYTNDDLERFHQK
jgi:hypothetical protein